MTQDEAIQAAEIGTAIEGLLGIPGVREALERRVQDWRDLLCSLPAGSELQAWAATKARLDEATDVVNYFDGLIAMGHEAQDALEKGDFGAETSAFA